MRCQSLHGVVFWCNSRKIINEVYAQKKYFFETNLILRTDYRKNSFLHLVKN